MTDPRSWEYFSSFRPAALLHSGWCPLSLLLQASPSNAVALLQVFTRRNVPRLSVVIVIHLNPPDAQKRGQQPWNYPARNPGISGSLLSNTSHSLTKYDHHALSWKDEAFLLRVSSLTTALQYLSDPVRDWISITCRKRTIRMHFYQSLIRIAHECTVTISGAGSTCICILAKGTGTEASELRTKIIS